MTNHFFTFVFFAIAITSLSNPSYAVVTKAAQYIVPARNAAEAAQVYSISGEISTSANHAQQLHFKLPADLVGAKPLDNVLDAIPSTQENMLQFSSAQATATCTQAQSILNCVLLYSPGYATSMIDPLAVQKFLNLKYGQNTALLKSKLAQAVQFQNDPQGVLILFR